MRILLIFLFAALAFPQAGVMRVQRRTAAPTAYAYVGHMSGNTSDTNSVTTTAGSCSGANMIVAVVTMWAHDPSTAVMSNTSTSAWHVAVNNYGGADGTAIWYTDGKALSGSETVTGTLSGSQISISAECYSGAPVSGALDLSATGPAGPSLCQPTSSITPTQNNALVIAGFGGAPDPGTTSVPGYAITDVSLGASGTAEGGGIAYVIQTTATATRPTMSSGNGVGPCSIVSFKH